MRHFINISSRSMQSEDRCTLSNSLRSAGFAKQHSDILLMLNFTSLFSEEYSTFFSSSLRPPGCNIEFEGKQTYCTVLYCLFTERKNCTWLLKFREWPSSWWLSAVVAQFKGIILYDRQTDGANRAHRPDAESDALQRLCCLHQCYVPKKVTQSPALHDKHKTSLSLFKIKLSVKLKIISPLYKIKANR